MRVVKKIYGRDEKTLLASRLFDDIIRNIDLPMNFDVLEFNFGYGSTHVSDEKVVIGIDFEDKMFSDKDRRTIRTMITMEFFRVSVRKKLDEPIPRMVEDVLVARDMIKNGYAEDLIYVFYIFLMKHRITGIKDYIRFNLPWIIFSGQDPHVEEIFRDIAKTRLRNRHEKSTSFLFNALKKDLWIDKNRKKAVTLYEAITNAGDQVQMEHS